MTKKQHQKILSPSCMRERIGFTKKVINKLPLGITAKYQSEKADRMLKKILVRTSIGDFLKVSFFNIKKIHLLHIPFKSKTKGGLNHDKAE